MESEHPLVTVITATFNLIKDGREQFFHQCVESVRNQTYPNIEHIVMDGASTDGSLNLIKQYENKGWLKCYSEPDEGMWDGMNKGLKIAKGKYICFLNSDDFYFSNDVLAKCINKLEEENTDYLFSDFNLIKRNGEFCDHVASFPIEKFYFTMPYNHESLICRKSIYEKLGFYDTKYRTTIDYAFAIKLILNDCSYSYLPITSIVARLGGGTTPNINSFAPDVLKTVSLLYKDVFTSFYPITDEECINLFLHKKGRAKFFNRLAWYMVMKNLKHFNYAFFLKTLNVFTDVPSKVTTIYKLSLFNFIPIGKIIKRNTSLRFYLFGFLPIFKWKEE